MYTRDLDLAINGDKSALARLFETHRKRLRRMVTARLSDDMAARVTESDVLQDVFVEAQRRIVDFDPDDVPLFIWLRTLTGQRLIQLHRFHVQAAKRSTLREVCLSRRKYPGASTASLARFLMDRLSSVSKAVERSEIAEQVQRELEFLSDTEREIISLRHFEKLTNEEAAVVLEMNPSTTSTRHLRALHKLKKRLETNPALREYLREFN